MSVDVSPDGKTIIFDLLGDLYTLPINGGKATRITDGQAYDAQPRFSPDGKSIVFMSDRSGNDNSVWTAAADGRDARMIAQHGRWEPTHSPEWTPDGRIVVGRHSREKGVGGVWMYHIAGGKGLLLPGSAGDGPAFGTNPQHMYVSRKKEGYPQIAEVNLDTGESRDVVVRRGGAFRPALSPDGRYLVYGTRLIAKTALMLLDLRTGQERILVPEAQDGAIEGYGAQLDFLPGSAFTPDGSALITSYGGKLWRIDVSSGESTAIPFTADIDQMIGPLVRFQFPFDDKTETARYIQTPRISPDGRQVAFVAFGRLYVMRLPHGKPHRVTELNMMEYSPAWSPDGKSLAFLTWDDRDGGSVYRVLTRKRGFASPQRLSREYANFEKMVYSPDGRRLVMGRSAVHSRRTGVDGMRSDADFKLVWMPEQGGPLTTIAPLSVYGFGWPHFRGFDASRIYISLGHQELVSMLWNGMDRRTHLKIATDVDLVPWDCFLTDDMQISPDGLQAVVAAWNRIYVTMLPPQAAASTPITLRALMNAPFPVRQISRQDVYSPQWSRDGRAIRFIQGNAYLSYDTERGGDAVHYADLLVTEPKDRPVGTLVLLGARIISLRGDEVIPQGDIVIRDNRIVAIGASNTVALPLEAKTIAMTGKTIIPGFIDVHAHMFFGHYLQHSSQEWQLLANLAYGVTTAHDPQPGTYELLSYKNRVEMGQLLGPRILTSGVPISGMSSENPQSLEEVRSAVRPHAESYGTNTLKQYGVGTRNQRQWAVMAAKEFGLNVTTEGASSIKYNLTNILDGYSGQEHNFPLHPLYKDWVTLIAEARTIYTPTLVNDYGGVPADQYMLEREDLIRNSKLRRFTPDDVLARYALRGSAAWTSESQWQFRKHAIDVARIVAAGGKVALGGHGQLQGLGSHWELWLMAMGGVKPLDLLRIATLNGAIAIGMDEHLGSLEPGKLADLLVLDRNPLENIRNTDSLRFVMKNGRLYDAETLDEVWPRSRNVGPQYWSDQRISDWPTRGTSGPMSSSESIP